MKIFASMMKLFSSLFAWDLAAIILVTFSFVIDKNINPLEMGLFNASERALSSGYTKLKVLPAADTSNSPVLEVAQVDESRVFGRMAVNSTPLKLGSAVSDDSDSTASPNSSPVFFAYSAHSFE